MKRRASSTKSLRANRDWRAFTVSLLGQTKARELELSLAQLCKPHFATKSLQQKELAAAYAFMAQADGPTRARELELTIAQLCKHQFAQKSIQPTELLGKEFGENTNFKELLGEETEEHITNPKLAQEEMAENLTIPQLHRKENEKNFADKLPKLEDQKSQQKLEAIVGYQASIFEFLALGSQELAEHIATIGKKTGQSLQSKMFSELMLTNWSKSALGIASLRPKFAQRKIFSFEFDIDFEIDNLLTA